MARCWCCSPARHRPSAQSTRAPRRLPASRPLPLPPSLRGGAAQKVVGTLLARGLLAEVDAAHGTPDRRETADGRSVTLIATEAAVVALGLETDTSPACDSRAPGSAGRVL